uniref:Replication factor C subunit 5 n=1 Tax=Aceria tosichella TaxID=561515 RepID=A0A6G1SL59_9ACAR
MTSSTVVSPMDISDITYDDHVPWIEKYRPQTLDDLASHADIKMTLEKFMKDGSLPHLLFHGPPGTGKTSTILACARKLYKPDQLGQMVLELNASDDRGIDIVRGPILNFASSRAMYSDAKFKLVILDEAEQMTSDAQSALRRIIEKYADNTRFCLITNYMNKIIPAIQSRCTRFRFGPLTAEQIMPRMDLIIQNENIKITEDGRRAVHELSQGDMRRVVNLLQSCYMSFHGETIDETKVYQCCGHPLRSDVAKMVDFLLNSDIKTAYEGIQKMKIEKGLALQDIMTQVSKAVSETTKISQESKMHIHIRMADIEYHLNNGGSEKIYLSAMISAFAGRANQPITLN